MLTSAFLDQLFSTGDIVFPPSADSLPGEDEGRSVRSVLEAENDEWRSHLPGDPPPLDFGIAEWSAEVVCRACYLLADRSVEDAEVAASLAILPPSGNDPDSIDPSVRALSADLCLRFLPSLHRLARQVASADVLVGVLEKLGGEWPLSSVGIRLDPERVEHFDLPFLADPCVRQLYVDRIVAARDTSRLGDDGAEEAVRASLGSSFADYFPLGTNAGSEAV